MKEIGWIESKEELKALVATGKNNSKEGPETEVAGKTFLIMRTLTDGDSKSSSRGSGTIAGMAASPFDFFLLDQLMSTIQMRQCPQIHFLQELPLHLLQLRKTCLNIG